MIELTWLALGFNYPRLIWQTYAAPNQRLWTVLNCSSSPTRKWKAGTQPVASPRSELQKNVNLKIKIDSGAHWSAISQRLLQINSSKNIFTCRKMWKKIVADLKWWGLCCAFFLCVFNNMNPFWVAKCFKLECYIRSFNPSRS